MNIAEPGGVFDIRCVSHFSLPATFVKQTLRLVKGDRRSRLEQNNDAGDGKKRPYQQKKPWLFAGN